MPVIGVSDHYPICCTWSKKGVKIPRVEHSHLTYRSFARFDESEFLNDLNNAPFDKVYNHTDPVFLKVLDKHAPQKKRRIKYSFKPGWLTLEVLDAMRYRDYLLKLKLFDEYKKQRNKVIYMIRNSTTTKQMLAFWQTVRIQKTRGELLIYSLINTHQRILALLVEFPQMT